MQRIADERPPEDDGDILLPDRVLVFETKSPVDKFWKTVERIDGLDALAEWLRPDRSSDEDADSKDARLYLTLPNRSALAEIERLWRAHQSGENPPYGFRPLWEVFELLTDLRRWGVRDRLPNDTRAYLEDQVQRIADGEISDGIGVEIELWPYAEEESISQGIESVKKLVLQTEGARLVNVCHISGPRVGIVLAVVPANLIRQLLRADNVAMIDRDDLKKLADAPAIQSFGARGQAAVDPLGSEDAASEWVLPDQGDEVDTENSDVAILDTPLVAQHQWIRSWSTVSDPFELEPLVQVSDRRHGTAMASLAIHGNLEDPTSLRRSILNVPIMVASQNFNGQIEAHIPEGTILADFLHRAVRHIFEDDGLGGPLGRDVKIVNVSIGDRNRPFVGRASAAARVLDYLAYRYNVLIIVSAGNFSDPIEINVSQTEFETATDEEKKRYLLDYFRNQALQESGRPPTIFSPAEAANALTIGGRDYDPDCGKGPLSPTTQHRFRADRSYHAPYSRIGSGVQGQVKPDIIFDSGSPVYNVMGDTQKTILRLAPSLQFGFKEASTGQGLQAPTVRSVGTSGAAARASNSAGRIAEMLGQIENPEPVPSEYIAVLCKTLLVHGCQGGDWFDQAAQLHLSHSASATRDYEDLTRFFGYGKPDVDRVLECTENRATVIGFGELPANKDAAQNFEFPIPPSLNGQAILRRVVVTLAWFSPCDGQRVAYKRARLEAVVEPNKDALTDDKRGPTRGNGRHLDTRGTVIHRVFEGSSATSFNQYQTLPVRVERAAVSSLPASDPVKFGLAVTLDAGLQAGVDLPVYQEIEQRLRARASVRAQG